ncbi:MAG: hypothetical protein IPL33_20570 [Sphingobacteriales bacterium]|nr:hypothetical protein [Sphingobacteriales bacterium]
MLRRVSLLCASDWESSHNRRQRPHSRSMPSRGRFARISRVPPMRVMDGCVSLAVVFALMRRNLLATEG